MSESDGRQSSRCRWALVVVVLALIDRREHLGLAPEPSASEEPEPGSMPISSGAITVSSIRDDEQEAPPPYRDIDVREHVDAFADRLAQLREAVVVSGQHLLSWDELDQEIAERRGDVA